MTSQQAVSYKDRYLIKQVFLSLQAEEDFFVMQTMDSTFGIHTPGRESMDDGIRLTPKPRTGCADIDFDLALAL